MSSVPTDFNDLHQRLGLEAVRKNLVIVTRPEVDEEAMVRAMPVMPETAYPELLRKIIEAACRSSEAHPVAVAANVIAFFCTSLGRVTMQRIGDARIHARPFFIVAGRSGKARKGTAEHTPREVARRADEVLRDRHGHDLRLRVHSGGLSTGEGIGFAIRDPREADEKGKGGDLGVRDKRLMVIEPEMANVLAQVKRDGNTLSPVLRNLWDGRDLEPMTKTSQVIASNPHVVLIGHITGHELVEKSTENDAANGLLNRFVMLHVYRPKLVALPEPTPDDVLDQLAMEFADAVDFATRGDPLANNTHEVRLSHEAAEAWCDLYPEITRDRDGRTGSLMARSEVYARMLAMVFALMDRRDEIEPCDLLMAGEWVRYWAASIDYIFSGDDADADQLEAFTQQVMQHVIDRPGVMLSELGKAVGNNNETDKVHAALDTLANLAPPLVEVRKESRTGRGRPAQRCYPTAHALTVYGKTGK